MDYISFTDWHDDHSQRNFGCVTSFKDDILMCDSYNRKMIVVDINGTYLANLTFPNKLYEPRAIAMTQTQTGKPYSAVMARADEYASKTFLKINFVLTSKKPK